MRKYLAVIIPCAIAAPFALILLWSAFAPPKMRPLQEQLSPSVAESYRMDRERSEQFRRQEDRKQQEREILKKALEDCQSRKIGNEAVMRCVAQATQ